MWQGLFIYWTLHACNLNMHQCEHTCACNSLFGVVSCCLSLLYIMRGQPWYTLLVLCPYIHFVRYAHLFTCRLNINNIGDAGAKALGEGLQHYTKLQKLRYFGGGESTFLVVRLNTIIIRAHKIFVHAHYFHVLPIAS